MKRTLILFSCLLGAAWFIDEHLRWNHTASVPVGLYITSAQGQFLEFCPYEPWAKLSAIREYRPRQWVLGCPDGYQPLLKRIVAKAGDLVIFDEKRGVEVNGEVLKDSKPSGKDSAGRPLTHFPSGMASLQPGEYWVMGDHGMSFDSRYFGPVNSSQIRRRLRPF